ncbi:MAG: hypothetical protein PHV63_04760 [Candidatus Daviesbacteria bacterium]|nr:hypothetical protein [Candidatus Daviesbacteria bacterium]
MLSGGIISLFVLLLLLAGAVAVLSNIVIFPLALYKGFAKKSWKLLLVSALLFGGGILVVIISSAIWAAVNLTGASPLQQNNKPLIERIE